MISGKLSNSIGSASAALNLDAVVLLICPMFLPRYRCWPESAGCFIDIAREHRAKDKRATPTMGRTDCAPSSVVQVDIGRASLLTLLLPFPGVRSAYPAPRQRPQATQSGPSPVRPK